MRKKKRKMLTLVIDLICVTAIVFSNYFYMYCMPQGGIKEKNIFRPVTAEANTKYWSRKFKNKFTNYKVKTPRSYTSSDISIKVNKKSYGNINSKITYYIADVYISNIQCIQTHFANDTYGYGYKEKLKTMASRNDAVFAINGDSYSNNRQRSNGTIIRNGRVYSESEASSDVCVLFNDGTMKTYTADEFNSANLDKNNIYQTWVFGPKLLDNNGKALKTFNTWDYIRKAHPRAAIGYKEPGHYYMIVADGRGEGDARGMYLSELAKVFEDLGCKEAYNLDGGYSSFMDLNGKYINNSKRPNKTVTDGIFIEEVN